MRLDFQRSFEVHEGVNNKLKLSDSTINGQVLTIMMSASTFRKGEKLDPFTETPQNNKRQLIAKLTSHFA